MKSTHKDRERDVDRLHDTRKLCEGSTDRCWESIYLQRRGTVTRRGSLCSDTVVLEPLRLQPHFFPDDVCDDCYRWSFAVRISRSIARRFERDENLKAAMMFRESWRMMRKKFFFLLGITRESGRELSKGDCSCRWLTKKLCNPSFIFPFSRAFDDCKISLSEILCRNVWEARDLKERDFEVLLTRDRETIVTNKLFVRQRRSETTYNLVLLRTNPYPRYFLWEKPASLRNARICIV